MIIPRVKKYKEYPSLLQLGKSLQCIVNNEYSDFVISLFQKFLLQAETSDRGLIKFEQDFSLKKEEYLINIEEEAVIFYADKLGLRNAIVSFIQLVSIKEGVYYVKKVFIKDKPDFYHRAVMIDIARGIPDVGRLKEDLLRSALFKCNYLHLHFMDSKGLAYKSDVVSFDGKINGTDRIDKKIISEIVEYAEQLGLETIPEIEMPSHTTDFYWALPELRCQTDLEDPSPANVCVGSEKTYGFYEKLIQEVVELFPCKYFHVGGDELMFDDFPDWNYHCQWDQCKVCSAVMKQKGIKNNTEMFYYAMRRIHEILKKYGKTMIMWNDSIDVSKDFDIPKDVIIQFWRIAYNKRGPHENCSVLKLAESGYKIINSNMTDCYIDEERLLNAEKTAIFKANQVKGSDRKFKNIIGSEVCAWEYGNPKNTHYLTSFAFSSAILLDKLWNAKDVVYDKGFRRSLTKALFGVQTPENYDVTELFGSIIPPRINGTATYATPNNGLAFEEDIVAHLDRLQTCVFGYSANLIKNICSAFKN